LIDEARGYARLAAVNALSAWVARAPGNGALLEEQLAPKVRREGEPELVVRLLRGFVSPATPEPADLDQLVEFLTSPSVAVRELAQWNLVNFVDPAAARTPGMVVDVAANTAPGYDKFVKAWKARVEEVKAGGPPKK
jgi:hypothetical protein